MTDSRHRWVLLQHQVGIGSPLGSGGDQSVGNLGRGDHFDLMLSPPDAGPLWTWAIPANPLAQTLPVECEVDRLPDHRRIYLDYEGPISGDRGQVYQAAKGTYEVVAWSEHQIDVRLWSEELRHPLKETSEQNDSFRISLTRQPVTWLLSCSVPF